MSEAFNAVGVVLGVLGVAGTVQLAKIIFDWNIPHRRLKALEGLLTDIDILFQDSVEDGLPFDPGWIENMETTLSRAHSEAEILRAEVHLASSKQEEIVAMWKGLSKRIRDACHRMTQLRADLASDVDEARGRLMVELTRYTRNAPLGFPSTQLVNGQSSAQAGFQAPRARPSALWTGPPVVNNGPVMRGQKWTVGSSPVPPHMLTVPRVEVTRVASRHSPSAGSPSPAAQSDSRNLIRMVAALNSTVAELRSTISGSNAASSSKQADLAALDKVTEQLQTFSGLDSRTLLSKRGP